MLPKYFYGTVQWQGFGGPSLSGDGGGPEKRVVDRFFRGFDDGKKEW